MTFLELVARAKAENDYRTLVEAIPYARFLGLDVELAAEGPVSRLPFQEMLIGNPVLPALHGGVVGALLEHAAIVHLMWSVETARLPKIIDLSVDYLRSGRPRDTFAKGVVTRHGRLVASVQIEAWQDDPERPIAHGSAHFLMA